MTISSTTNRVSYSGNGVTLQFSFPYLFLADGDLKVYLRLTTTGVQTLQTISTHYTVTGAGLGTGHVDFLTAPPTGYTVHIIRDPDPTSLADYTSGDAFASTTTENAFDKIATEFQAMRDRFSRTLMQQETAANLNLTLPEPSLAVASKYLAVNTAGTGYELRTGSSALAYGTVFSDAHTAAIANLNVGAMDYVVTTFNGDISKMPFPISLTTAGAATLTQPTTGYTQHPYYSALYGYYQNTSGWNQGTADNTGRTGNALMYLKADQLGQGDAGCITLSAFVNQTKALSTSTLANPAGFLINGGMTAGQDGVYLNALEFNLNGSTYDVSAAGLVFNMNRTNVTGAKGAYWLPFRAQSTGSGAIDSFFSATGKANQGLDVSNATITSGAAITMKAGQYIYGAVTAGTFFPSALGTPKFGHDGTDWSLVGGLKFGTHTGNADAAVNGYITIKDAAGNSRKLATIA